LAKEEKMPDYVLLMKLTDEGAGHIDDAPERITRAKDSWKALGGELVSFYVTFGEYDYVAVGRMDKPDEIADQLALGFVMALAREGTVRTLTLKGYGVDILPSLLQTPPAPYHRRAPSE
jgi:uncharacterized protein with GYD domain